MNLDYKIKFFTFDTSLLSDLEFILKKAFSFNVKDNLFSKRSDKKIIFGLYKEEDKTQNSQKRKIDEKKQFFKSIEDTFKKQNYTFEDRFTTKNSNLKSYSKKTVGSDFYVETSSLKNQEPNHGSFYIKENKVKVEGINLGSQSESKTVPSQERNTSVSLTNKIQGSVELIGPIRLPLRNKHQTVNKSPHVNKKSRDQFKLTKHSVVQVLKTRFDTHLPLALKKELEEKLIINFLKVINEIKLNNSINVTISYYKTIQ